MDHFRITAGTLGAFVTRSGDSRAHILSNNHVLANENNAAANDNILQPGDFDGGVNPGDRVAELTAFVPLAFAGDNDVDCACALVDAAIQADTGNLDTRGRLATAAPMPASVNETVFKIGRTTGLTDGVITAIEVGNILDRVRRGPGDLQ